MDELNVGDAVEVSAPTIEDNPVGDEQSWDSLAEAARSRAPEADLEPVIESEPAPAADEAETPEADAEPDPAAEDPEKSEQPKELPKDKRTWKFNELKEAVPRLEAELQQAAAKIEEIDGQLEEFGGVEGFKEAVGTLEILMNPGKAAEAATLIETLPHGGQLQSIFTARMLGIGSEDVPEAAMQSVMGNQAVVFNTTLQKYQGLEKAFTPEEVDKIGQYLSLRANDNKADLFEEIDEELTNRVNPEENEIQKLRTELEAIKAGKTNTPEAKAEAEPPETFYLKHAERCDQYEESVYPTAVGPVLKEYGLEVLPTDPVEIKTAKESLNKAIFAYQSLDGRKSTAFEQVSNYLMAKAEEHPQFKFVESAYKRTTKLAAEKLLKDISPLFKGVTVPQKKRGTQQTPTGDALTVSKSSKEAQTWDELQDQSRPRR